VFITVRASFDRFNLADSTISWMVFGNKYSGCQKLENK
jgi:hypothetical protein